MIFLLLYGIDHVPGFLMHDALRFVGDLHELRLSLQLDGDVNGPSVVSFGV